MFRLSDYDFRWSEKDYVAFMDVVKKFITMIREVSEEETPYECVILDKAENLALQYVDMRRYIAVGDELKAFIYECVNYLGYNCIMLDERDNDEIDELLWDIYGDLS